MKRTVLFLLALLAATMSIHAQQHLLRGNVVNEKTGEAIMYATVRLMEHDTVLVAGATTDAKGQFSIETDHGGRFNLRVSYVSFGTKNVLLELPAERSDTLDLGRIALSSTEVELGAAVVKAAAARVEQKEDTTVFNAAAYRTPEGSTIEALIQQLPGVEVEDDGTIKWNGKTVTEFLINGKDFFKGDTKVAMKNLPTELISKIKAYDKQSEYTEQTGIDDGEETTVLDLTTKRALNESWITNADVAYGTKDRYSGRVFISRFTDQSHVTAFGSINNTNDMGFGGPRGWGGGNGLTATKNAGLDFNWENGKEKREAGQLEVGGGVRYNHTGTDALSTTASETFLTGGSNSSFGNKCSRSVGSSTSVNSDFRLRWNPDSMTRITFRPSYSYSKNRSESSSWSATFNSDPYEIEGMQNPVDSIFADMMGSSLTFEDILASPLGQIAVNRNRRQSLSESHSHDVSGSLMVVRRLRKQGRNISLRASGGWSNTESESFSISNIRYFQNSTTENNSYLNQYTLNPSKNWNYSVRLSYTEPIAKNWYAEGRYQYSYRFSDSDRSLYNLDEIEPTEGMPTWWDSENYPALGTVPTQQEVLEDVRDRENSQYATYKYSNHSVFGGVRYITEKIRFNAGLDFQPQRTRMQYNRPLQIDTIITRKVFNFSPQVRFRYRFSKTNQLDIRYRGSSSQPSMTNLLDVVDDSDPLNISMGNPGLKPSWTNSLRAFYRGYDADKQRGMAGGVDFSQTSNSISTLMVYDETNGTRYTRPENINGNWNANGHFMFNTALGAEQLFNITTFTNLGYDNSVGYVRTYSSTQSSAVSRLQALATSGEYDKIFTSAPASKNTTRTLNVRENLRLSYRASWFDVGVFGRVSYQHSRNELQTNANMDTWNFSYGANANFNFSWGMALSTDLSMSSRRGYADASMNTNEFVWNAQISQSFLKGNAATISLQFYDILHQQSNVSRVINAQMRSDSWNNAINSYCMVHFIYRLNIFNGKRSNGEEKGKDGERRGPRMGPPMRAMPMMGPAMRR